MKKHEQNTDLLEIKRKPMLSPNKIKALVVLFLTIIIVSNKYPDDFISEQKRYPRVRMAISDKGSIINENLKKYGINISDVNVLFIVYKEEKRLDVFAKNKNDSKYKKIADYQICRISGRLGPKRKQGDRQVPEGFYHIDRFNPASNFFLSLGINYPNQADTKKSQSGNPGDNIFIHGACVSIGCLAMTDEKIKEIYLYALYSRQNGQRRIPVYIFPFEMSEQNMRKYKRTHRFNSTLIEFWENILQGYDFFQKEKTEPKFFINSNGDYIFVK